MSTVDVITVVINGNPRPVIQVDVDRKELVWRMPCSERELAFYLTNRTAPVTNSEVALCLAYQLTAQSEKIASLERKLDSALGDLRRATEKAP